MIIKALKKDIILEENSYYFDYTASALALKSIEKKMQNILKSYANIHSEGSLHAARTDYYYKNSKEYIKACLKLDKSFALIACGYGCSFAIKRFQELLGIYVPPKVKELYFKDFDKSKAALVIVGPYEHHSNELSFREGLCECIRVPLDKEGGIDFEALSLILEKNKARKIIASFSACSNVTGIRSDYKRLFELIKAKNGILALDLASLIAHENIDMNYADAIFISSHKLLGGVGGAGLLAIKKNLCPDIPSFAGGGTVQYVSRKSQIYHEDVELREEGGTPGILELIRSSYAFKVREIVGLKNIEEKEKKLSSYFFKKLEEIDELTLYAANNKNRLPIFSFNIKGKSPYELAFRLSKDFHIETRAGCACAGPYGHDLLGLEDGASFSQKPGWLRVSLHYTHSFKELDFILASLKKLIKNT